MVTPPPIEVANIGMADSFVLMVLALVVFGPRRLPQIGRQIGKLMYEFRKASNDFKFQMEEELRNAEEADRRKREEAERQQRLALTAETQSTEASAGPAATTETAAASTATEPAYPRVQPPSTGEQVAAERPGSTAAAAEETPAIPEANPAEKETVANDSSTVTEHAAHNG
jgi:sec-independent protein translocase protein TatB